MSKILIVLVLVLTAGLSALAQSTNHPREKTAFEKLSPEQKEKVLEMKSKIQNMTAEERKAFFAQHGGNHPGGGRPGRGGSNYRFSQLPSEKQAEINAMKEKIKNMTTEERKAYFAQNGRPGRWGRG